MRSRIALAVLTALALGAGVLALAPLEGGASVGGSATAPAYRSRNYEVETYRGILRRARSTVGLARRGSDRIFASGVLVAPDLVLTCRHATHLHSADAARHEPTALQVILEGPGDARHSFPVIAYAHTSERYDLCVLRLGRDAHGDLPEADRVVTPSTERVPLGAPLYVIHHPRGEGLRVADDARVLFPYQATEEELTRIAARLADEGGTPSGALAALRASYRKTAADRSANFSARWAGQPVLGADCATFDGSSGAPVYDKRTHAFVGIVFAGGNPARRGPRTSWENHEAILPAPVIAAELEMAGLLTEP